VSARMTPDFLHMYSWKTTMKILNTFKPLLLLAPLVLPNLCAGQTLTATKDIGDSSFLVQHAGDYIYQSTTDISCYVSAPDYDGELETKVTNGYHDQDKIKQWSKEVTITVTDVTSSHGYSCITTTLTLDKPSKPFTATLSSTNSHDWTSVSGTGTTEQTLSVDATVPDSIDIGAIIPAGTSIGSFNTTTEGDGILTLCGDTDNGQSIGATLKNETGDDAGIFEITLQGGGGRETANCITTSSDAGYDYVYKNNGTKGRFSGHLTAKVTIS
jgi:hypothetical protein